MSERGSIGPDYASSFPNAGTTPAQIIDELNLEFIDGLIDKQSLSNGKQSI